MGLLYGDCIGFYRLVGCRVYMGITRVYRRAILVCTVPGYSEQPQLFKTAPVYRVLMGSAWRDNV